MSSTTPFSPISPSDLFDRLAAGLAGGMTVVTPNARLAQALLGEFDAAQAAKGLQTWETADVLPWTAFVARLYDEALYAAESGSAARLPILLTQPQELSLWEQAIEASPWGGGELLALSQAAADARQAWNTCHEWRIAEPALDLNNGIPRNEDAEAFAKWAAHYRQRCERDRDIDAARLPDLVTALLKKGQLATPRQITAYAFDILPPQALMLFDACRERGTELHRCAADPCRADVRRWPFASTREEIETAARWARARLEAGHAPSDPHADQTSQTNRTSGAPRRIGIVVPDLQLRRKEVARVLSRTLTPGHGLPDLHAKEQVGDDAPRAAPAFNISIGVPLGDYAIVHAALALIELATGESDFVLASRVLRSPFIGGAQTEAMLRARIDAQLRRIATPRLTLPRLIAQLGDCAPAPLLLRHLEALLECARGFVADQGEGRRSTHTAQAWAQHFAALLKAAGFPGERSLDSAEYQTHAKWTETLAQFARLGRVLPPISARDALSRLRRLCNDTLFQPESGSAPIQVLGILESAGLNYDHLWVCGLTDEAWPLAARPNPFIPTLLQKKAGIPEASAEGALALDRRITDNWLGAAPEVVLSHALREDDRELPVSPLIAALPEGTLELPDYPDYRDVLFAARALEPLAAAAADQAPALGDTPVHGGARVLADQSACPFRAFAHHRLGAQALESPTEGLDAAARGTLLHALMKGIWDDLKNKATLDATTGESLMVIIEKSAAAAVARAQRDLVIEPRFAELERARLARLALEWLEVERLRPDFEVVASEEKRALVAGGISLSGRIDRLDRLSSGGHAMIDYKSGRVTPNSWQGDRPDDPQMPLYAVNAAEDITAVAFARIKKGDMRMMGFSRDDKVLPRVTLYRDWKILLAEWKEEVDDLGREFASGAAGVDPKRGQQTCRYCDLAPLCRVHEKFSALELEGDQDTDADGTGSDGGMEAAS
jgi:ATP-dependent helicase/nuclease subunit B